MLLPWGRSTGSRRKQELPHASWEAEEHEEIENGMRDVCWGDPENDCVTWLVNEEDWGETENEEEG